MPLQEVYTISGAGFGAGGPSMVSPDLLKTAAAASSAPPPVQLQNALKALGNTAGDGLLSSIKVDGVIGPATVKAVNHALAHYVGATKYFPKANLTLQTVRQYAGGLAGIIAERVQKSGGIVPPAQIDKPAVRRSSMPPVPPMPESPAGPPRWIWWVVGGVSVLLVLAVAARAVSARKAA